jgi:hypothetical protein
LLPLKSHSFWEWLFCLCFFGLSLMLTGLCGGCLTGVPEYRQPPHSPISIRVWASKLKQPFVLITQQVLLNLTHSVSWKLCHHKTLLRNFEVRQL